MHLDNSEILVSIVVFILDLSKAYVKIDDRKNEFVMR